jgi:hypothetical protein
MGNFTLLLVAALTGHLTDFDIVDQWTLVQAFPCTRRRAALLLTQDAAKCEREETF